MNKESLIEESFRYLFPEKKWTYRAHIRYSGKFKPYGANIRLCDNQLTVHLAQEWKEVSTEIQLGVVQGLLMRLFRKQVTKYTSAQSFYIDLYHNFVRNLHLAAPRIQSNPLLVAAFQRLNTRYFTGILEEPNLVFGQESMRKLGSYDFRTDTIALSSIFQSLEPELLEYVLYHEMLHKHFKFKVCHGGRSRYHTAAFRKREQEFDNAAALEKALQERLQKKSRKLMWKNLFLFH